MNKNGEVRGIDLDDKNMRQKTESMGIDGGLDRRCA